MGDIADGLIDGSFDAVTGEYIGEACGYPRSIYGDPYIGMRGKHSSINGVKNFLRKFQLESKNYHQHCVDFIMENHIEREGQSNSWKVVADIIQDNWKRFVAYTNNCYNRKP